MVTPWENKNKMTNKPKIAIAIPYNGKWYPEWTEKVYVPLKYVPISWCDKQTFLCKVPSISVARDILVNSALKAGCDYVFFLDTDLIFETPIDPNKALEILYQVINKDPNKKDGKIVSGLYRAKQKTGFSYAMWMKAPNNINGFVSIQEWTGNWIQVDTVGLGCCLINIEIFKSMKRPFFHWELNEDVSEDFYFFKLAKEHGYDLHAFTDVKLSHLGTLKVKCNGDIVIPEM